MHDITSPTLELACHSLCKQTKRLYLSNNPNGLEKEQKSNFEEIMVNLL